MNLLHLGRWSRILSKSNHKLWNLMSWWIASSFSYGASLKYCWQYKVVEVVVTSSVRPRLEYFFVAAAVQSVWLYSIVVTVFLFCSWSFGGSWQPIVVILKFMQSVFVHQAYHELILQAKKHSTVGCRSCADFNSWRWMSLIVCAVLLVTVRVNNSRVVKYYISYKASCPPHHFLQHSCTIINDYHDNALCSS